MSGRWTRSLCSSKRYSSPSGSPVFIRIIGEHTNAILHPRCIVRANEILRGYPKTFSHCRSEITQPPCGNETQGDRSERAYSA